MNAQLLAITMVVGLVTHPAHCFVTLRHIQFDITHSFICKSWFIELTVFPLTGF